MNFLVTGGAGFIGSHFVLQHCAKYPDDTVIVLDKMTYAADKSFLDPVIRRIRFIEGDIVDAVLLAEVISRYAIDVIVNFAAETHVDRSIVNATPFLYSNILGVQSLIEVCKQNPQVLLFHISTDEVYGDLADGERPKREDDMPHPSNPYSATKASAEMLLLAAARTHGIRMRISRCSNNYGPHQAAEKFLPTVIRTVSKNEKIPLYGNGENKRDWLYVEDHCSAVETLIQKGKDGEIYNITASDERRNIDVAREVLKIMGKGEDLISFVTDRPGHDRRYAIDAAKLKALGWAPSVPFHEGIRRTIEWYRHRVPQGKIK
jgi:dTDP-glucose 4,6-dehydratase